MKIKNFLFLFIIFSLSLSAQEEQKTSFSLEEAIAYAMQFAYDIEYANDDVAIASEKVRETTAIGLPQINGYVDYQNNLKQQISLIPAEFIGGAEGEFIEVAFGTKQNMNTRISLNQLIFDGSYLIGLKGVKTYLIQGENSLEKTEFIVKKTVANAYTYVLLIEENVKILEKNKAVLENNLNQTLKIVENGFAEVQDAEQLQLNLSAIINDLNKTNRIKASAYKVLNIALGIDINIPIVLTESLESLLLSNLDLALTQEKFDITQHIDYQIAATYKDSQELLMRFEKSKYLPSLNAFINVGSTANHEEFNFLNGDQKWFASSMLGVSLNVPIFSSFSRAAQTQQAKIELVKATRKLTETEQKLKVELQDARNNYQFAIDSYYISKNNLELAERIEHKESIKFFEGISSSFDLSNAQKQLYDRQQGYLESIQYLINSKVTLENALNIK